MDQHEKRELRNLKRSLKRKGTKRRRQHLKRDLQDNPEEAHLTEFEYDRDSSEWLNGIDNDRTRRRSSSEKDDADE
ncbi:MAG: hypothetical protein ACFCD0_30295 [Gemmataceae bacterium]